MIYLVAVNNIQADNYAKEHGLHRWEYKTITHYDQFRGIRLYHTTLIVKVGEWWKSKNLFNIDEIIRERTT